MVEGGEGGGRCRGSDGEQQATGEMRGGREGGMMGEGEG